MPIIAVGTDAVLYERTGLVGTEQELLGKLITEPPSLIVTTHPDSFLEAAHNHWKDHPAWNWRLMPKERQIGYGELAHIREETLIMYMGWRYKPSDTLYHYPISPSQYGRHSLDELGESHEPVSMILLRWGKELREFCHTHTLRVAPTAGGIASQLLRDSRFYPEPRRKVPTATNERARPHLPGNHYELRAKSDIIYAAAVVIDQEAAHHNAAQFVQLPHADSLYARGHWRNENAERKWLSLHDVRGLHGLLKVYGTIPLSVTMARWTPGNLITPGTKTFWIHTNEIEFMQQLGVSIKHVVAGWLAEDVDTGLQSYAEWAKAERSENPAWIKGTLLATYGILGSKPRPYKSVYRRSKKGKDTEVWIGRSRVKGKLIHTERLSQSPIAHVIQRGMIEAETNKRSILMARELEKQGIRVYAIQADAVVADGNTQLPLLPYPWRIKDRVAWVRFPNTQTYESLGPPQQKGVQHGLREAA
jgi:hypothetical protein